MRFSKMHGAGNDFVVLDLRDGRAPPDAATCARIADRHTGVGCDQLLTVETPRSEGAVASYRIWNSDGSVARQCGNGARCIAAWLVRDGAAPASGGFAIDSPAGRHDVARDVGAGIVIDSEADAEYEECRLKARFLTGLDPGFCLIETLLASRDEGIPHLELHLARLSASAGCLGFGLPLGGIRQALEAQRQALPTATPCRLRLSLHHDGRFELVAAALDRLAPGPVQVLLAPGSVDGADPLLRHKTSWRAVYDAAVAEALNRGAFDMLFRNRDGFLTEGGRSNLFLRIDGAWLTPPLAAGVLPGVMRSLLLQDPAWCAREAWLRPEDLLRAERIVVCNALRGPLEAVLVAGPV